MPTIRYDLEANTADFEAGLGKAAGAMKIGLQAAVALAAAVVALGAAYGKFVNSVVDVVDEVNTLSAAAGVSADTINGLRLAAQATGKELSAVVPKDLAKQIFEVSNGSGEALQAFEKLGIEATNLDGSLRDTDDVFRDIIDRLADVESPTERAALATKALGESGKELLSAFSDSDDLEHFVNLGREFGIEVGPNAATAASEWQVATANLSLAFENAGQTFLDTLGGPSLLADLVNNFSLGFTFIGKFVGEVVSDMIDNFGILGGVISDVMSGNFAEAKAATENLKFAQSALGDAYDAAFEEARGFWELAIHAPAPAAAAVQDAYVPALASIGTATGTVVDRLGDLEAATLSLREITKTATDDQLTDSARILEARDAQVAAIVAEQEALLVLQESGLDVSEALQESELALFEVRNRAQRDLTEIILEEEETRLERIQEIAEERRNAEAQADTERRAADEAYTAFVIEQAAQRQTAALGAIDSVLSATQTFADLAIAGAKDEGKALKDNIETLEEKLATTEDLTDGERRRIEAELKNLNAELSAEQATINRAFKGRQSAAITQVAIDAAASILALIPSFALLGPGAPAAAAAVVAPVAIAQSAVIAAQKPPQLHDGSANVDEIIATVRSNEAVLSQRGAEEIGRDRINAANRGTGSGGGMATQIVFRNRVLDQMLASTIEAGGRTERLLAAGRPPSGTSDPFGGV